MLKTLTKKEFAEKMGVSINWVTNIMGRAEFQKHQRGRFIIINSFLKKDLEEYLETKIYSTKTDYRYRIKYEKLLEQKFSCLDN